MTGTAPPPLHCPRLAAGHGIYYLLSTAVMFEDVATLDTGDQPSQPSPAQPRPASLGRVMELGFLSGCGDCGDWQLVMPHLSLVSS